MIFSTNGLPPVVKKDTGWYNRVEIIEVTHKLGDSEIDPQKLCSEKELSGLFNEAMSALRLLADHGWQFTNQMTLSDTKRLYEKLSNTVETFVQNHLEYADGKYVPRAGVYKVYAGYCERLHVLPLTREKFARELRANCSWLENVRSNDARLIEGKKCLVWPNTKLSWF